mmetsp:Transcript_26458/g.37255  ORF Transcript_26458/g.37255 Transcript_26458/m.37255 type:complete len:157 (+) Transcript_26458:107-577(+)
MATNYQISKKNIEEGEIERIEANDMKIGKVILLRDAFPCKIVEIHKSAPGKHGAAKIRTIGIDIFTARKYDELLTADEHVIAPVVNKNDYQLVAILDDNYVQLQANGETREDLRLDSADDFVDALISRFDSGEDVSINTVECLGVEKITGYRIIKA